MLSKALLDDLAVDWRRNGRKALRRLKRKSPLAYLRLIDAVVRRIPLVVEDDDATKAEIGRARSRDKRARVARNCDGTEVLRLEVTRDNIDAFIGIGLLSENRRADHAAIERAIGSLCRRGYQAIAAEQDADALIRRPLNPTPSRC